jgi:hypothetical protein
MANPFGSADQTLSKNTGHTNQANLIRAMVPRSSSKWVEVISATAITDLTNGTYDADGYFGGDSTRRDAQYQLPVNLSPVGGYTIIAGLLYNSGGSADGDLYFGLRDSVGLTANCLIRCDIYNRRFNAYIYDSNSNSSSIVDLYCSPGGDAFGAAIQASSTAQKSYARIGSTNYPTTPNSGTSSLGGSAVCNLFGLNYASIYKCQYLFLYDTMLSETDINDIIADPGAVLTQSGGGSTKRIMTLGVG